MRKGDKGNEQEWPLPYSFLPHELNAGCDLGIPT